MPVTTQIKPKSNPVDEYFPVGLSRAILSGVELSNDGGTLLLIFTNGGYRHVEYLSLSENAQKRQILIAKRLGQPISDADETAEVDWEKFVGKEYVIEVKVEEYQGKNKHKLEFAGVYPLDHADGKIVAFLQTAAGKRAAKGGQGVRPRATQAKLVNVDDV